jgi:hypothetical protein
MNPKDYINNTRITDYSFALSRFITQNQVDKETLENLYNFNLSLCSGSQALYPMSNWQSHRLCLMSSIAVKLNNQSYINTCEKLCIDWIKISDCGCCDAKSQDFHWRDSCEYVVYGHWALAQALVYLQTATKKPYKNLFNDYLKWIEPYQKGVLKHVEFVNSKNMPSDLSKPNYNKQFNPDYNKNFERVYNLLKS